MKWTSDSGLAYSSSRPGMPTRDSSTKLLMGGDARTASADCRLENALSAINRLLARLLQIIFGSFTVEAPANQW